LIILIRIMQIMTGSSSLGVGPPRWPACSPMPAWSRWSRWCPPLRSDREVLRQLHDAAALPFIEVHIDAADVDVASAVEQIIEALERVWEPAVARP
jgi:hypothetical protein